MNSKFLCPLTLPSENIFTPVQKHILNSGPVYRPFQNKCQIGNLDLIYRKSALFEKNNTNVCNEYRIY